MEKILEKIQLHIDSKKYSTKPNEYTMGKLSVRIVDQVADVTPSELANLVGNLGQSMVLATMSGTRLKINMIQQQVLALDFDNTIKDKYKQKIKATGENYQSYSTIKQNDFIQKYASFMYKTFSYSNDWEKFRVVFILDTPLYSNEDVRVAYKYLREKFPSSDPKTVDSSRLFLGGKSAEEINFKNKLPTTLFSNTDFATKKNSRNVTKNNYVPAYKLVKECEFEELSKRWKPYGGVNVPDLTAAIDYLIRIPMAELLETPGTSFRNIFEKDKNPSCSIWKPTDSEIWLYTQQNITTSNGTHPTYTIIQVMQKLLRNYYKKYNSDVPKDIALQFLIKYIGIKVEGTQEIQELRLQVDNFKKILLSDFLKSEYPSIYEIYGRYSTDIVAILDLVKEDLREDAGTLRCLTYKSVEHFAIELKCSKQKVSKLLNLMTFTGILKKLDKDQIPEQLLTNIQKNQTHKYTNGTYEIRKSPRKYHSNVYELTNVMENFSIIRDKCTALSAKGFTQKGFSKEWVERTFGKSEADRIFPQDKKRSISVVSNAITDDIHKVALTHIEADGYVVVNELKLEIQKLWGSKGFVDYKYSQAISELLEAYNIKKVRLTRELKDELGITGLPSKASPTILIKGN